MTKFNKHIACKHTENKIIKYSAKSAFISDRGKLNSMAYLYACGLNFSLIIPHSSFTIILNPRLMNYSFVLVHYIYLYGKIKCVKILRLKEKNCVSPHLVILLII